MISYVDISYHRVPTFQMQGLGPARDTTRWRRRLPWAWRPSATAAAAVSEHDRAQPEAGLV